MTTSDWFEQDRDMMTSLQKELNNEYAYCSSIIQKLTDNRDKVLSVLEKTLLEREHYKYDSYVCKLEHTISMCKGAIEKILIPRLNKFKLEIKQLLQLISTEAVSIYCLYKYQAFIQFDDETSSNVFSNYLINSELISLLCDKDIDVDSFGLEITSTLKKIDHLTKEIVKVNLNIQKYQQKINKCESEIKIYIDQFREQLYKDRIQLYELLGISESCFLEYTTIHDDGRGILYDITIGRYGERYRLLYHYTKSAKLLYKRIVDYFRSKLDILLKKYKRTLVRIKNCNSSRIYTHEYYWGRTGKFPPHYHEYKDKRYEDLVYDHKKFLHETRYNLKKMIDKCLSGLDLN